MTSSIAQSIAQTAGVDISKDHLDVCLPPAGAAKRFANDAKGFAALVACLAPHAPTRVVFEATGAYHRAFERAIGSKGLPMVKVNPRPRAALRRSTRQTRQNRSRRCGHAGPPRRRARAARAPHDRRCPRPDEGTARRAPRARSKDRVAAQNRQKNLTIALLKRQAARRLDEIDKQLAAIDAELDRLVKVDSDLAARFQSLVSIKGIGAATATAFALLIEMPERGTLESREAASLAGLAPVTRESDQWKGKSFISGGRFGLRQALSMPALVAIRFNADLKAKYQALIAAGKPPKVAITAVMRKLIVLANALLKDGRTWTPKLAWFVKV